MLTVQAVAGRPTACRLHSEALACTVEIDGLGPAALHWRLHRRGQPWDWTDRVNADPLRVELISDEGTESIGPTLEKDLKDGHVRMISGGAAEVMVSPHHRDGPTILPTSLYLALAQQWARAGVLALHAAAFQSPSGGILVTGNKGAGKSTLTAAAMAAGWPILTDDWLLLRLCDGKAIASRIRDFMMLRNSWATSQLRQHIPETRFQTEPGRPKQTLAFEAGDQRFLGQGTIEQVWSLQRPRAGRHQETRARPLSRVDAMARLIEASMPLLFSAQMPVERARLMQTVGNLTGQLPGWALQTGLNLVDSPAATLTNLQNQLAKGLGGPEPVDPSTPYC